MSALVSAMETPTQEPVKPGFWVEDGRVTMNIILPECVSSARLQFERPLTDEELLRLSARNELLRFEQEPNGDLTS